MTAIRATLLSISAAMLSGAALAAIEPLDNCATMLGSLAVELRFARALPPGRNTTFVCPKRFQPLIGASRERVLRALGPPDASAGNAEDGGNDWSYFFVARGGARAAGVPELQFRFDESWQVRGIDCRRLR